MLTQLEVSTPRITSSPLPFVEAGFAETDPIQIRGIEGLGPVDANVSTHKYGSLDGEMYNDSTVGNRNILITLGLNPNWATQSIESLRQLLYLYFMPKSRVRLRFSSTHLPQVEIIGYVENLRPNIFSKEPEYQLSIICPQPHFYDVNPTVITGTANAVGTDLETEINYPGTVETGFIMTLEPGGAPDRAGQLNIINRAPTQEAFSHTSAYASAANTTELSTEWGNKYITLLYTDGTTPMNLMRYVSTNSNWLTLKPGRNMFQVALGTGGSLWSIRFRSRYGGL